LIHGVMDNKIKKMDWETVDNVLLLDSISVGVGELTVRLGECEAFSHVPGEPKVLRGQLC